MARLILLLICVILYSCSPADIAVQILRKNLEKTGGTDAWRGLDRIQTSTKISTEIGGRTVSSVSEVRMIFLPDLQLIETYLGDSIIQKIITNDEGSYFYKMDTGKPIAATAMELEPIFINATLRLLDLDYSLEVRDTLFNDIAVYSLLDTVSGISYLFDKSNYLLIAQVEPSAYGMGLRQFDDFRQIGDYTFPYREVYSVPASGYRTIREIAQIDLMPKFDKQVFEQDDSWQVVKEGMALPEFQVDRFPGGNTIYKKDFLGKTTLIDFWATWCKPCIAEFPNIRAAYEAYQSVGFEVLSISLDQNQEMLESFLEKETLPWINAYEPDGFESALAKEFQLAAIPKPILVDEQGIIIALDREATGDSLNERLRDIFSKGN